MNPYLHLMWKEYRAVRLFWIAVVVLAVLLVWLIVAFRGNDLLASDRIIFHLLLGTPALFAIGCAGAAFAVEKEEGTIDFLRAKPVRGASVFASKMTLAAIASACMFVLLLTLAEWWTSNRLPGEQQFAALGLWLPAILEAIAWGTLFSLLTARPLVAIILAIAAATTSAHLLASIAHTKPNVPFELAAYLKAAPWRIALSIALLTIDVVLGLRWLDGREATGEKRQHKPRFPVSKHASGSVAVDATTVPIVERSPDRSTILGHLLWQHWQQSKWLMGSLAVVYVVLSLLLSPMLRALIQNRDFSVIGYDTAEVVQVFCMSLLAGLIGAFVFLPDQEQQRYRFFAEHNVPPRYIWLTRLSPWLLTACIAILAVCIYWVYTAANLQNLWEFLRISWRWWRYGLETSVNTYAYCPPLIVAALSALASFAGGQWMSMHIRSGILAGLFSVMLASVLFGWVLLMAVMRVNFWWSVLPIAIVLCWATWLRTPHWIAERTSWNARIKAAAAVAIPSLVLCVAVPYYRVHQVPLVSPGFDPESFLADNKSQAIETGRIYQRGIDLCTGRNVDASDAIDEAWRNRTVSEEVRELLNENQQALDLAIEASARPSCIMGDPSSAKQVPNSGKIYYLITLMIQNGWQLEAQGKLDDALDRYLAVLKLSNHLADQIGPWSGYRLSFQEIKQWACQPGQSPERIGTAIDKLQSIDIAVHFENVVKAQHIWARRAVLGDAQLRSDLFYAGPRDQHIARDALWERLMPWENNRALRVLNMLTRTSLARLEGMRNIAAEQERGVVDLLRAPDSFNSFLPPLHSLLRLEEPGVSYELNPTMYFTTVTTLASQAIQWVDWFETTFPNLNEPGNRGLQAAWKYARVEAERRAAIIVLALAAYRLEHGELPEKLSDLLDYLPQVPMDPYSSVEFQYFPKGPPVDNSSTEPISGLPWELGKPGIWCTGTRLRAKVEPSVAADETLTTTTRYELRRADHAATPLISIYEAIQYGIWFPIPPARTE